MAQRMLILAPTTPYCLCTTIRQLVVPVLGVNTSLASHYGNWSEAGGSYLDAESESAIATLKPLKLMEDKSTLTGGLINILDEYVRAKPGKRFIRIFKFSADRADKKFDEESNTLVQTLSCSNPRSRFKFLTQAIENGFGLELDAVEIIVDGNELEMRYRRQSVFRREVKAAEVYLEYAIKMVRARWSGTFQQHLLSSLKGDLLQRQTHVQKLRRYLYMNELADRTAAKRIKRAFDFVGDRNLSRQRGRVTDQDLATNWGRKLSEEIVQFWIEETINSRPRCSEARFFLVAFKCSGFSSEDIIAQQTPEERAPRLNSFSSVIKGYICSKLRHHTSPNGHEPAVTIHMTNNPDHAILKNHGFYIMQSTSKAEGNWIRIADANGPEPRRVLLCRSGNFYTAFNDFLRATDIGTFTSLDGYEHRLPSFSSICRKRKHGGQAPG